MRRLFVLRPEPGASASLERAKALGLDAQALPLFKVTPVAWRPPKAGSFDALLLTSANAIEHAGDALEALRGLPAYAVGEATAEAARGAGFDIAGSGDSGVERLLGSIEPGLRLLHLAGEDRHLPAGTRQTIESITVYRAAELPPPEGLEVLSGAVAVIHSPRAGRRLAELATDKSAVRLACISEAASDAVGDGWECKAASDKPTDDALLALAARLCDTKGG